MARPRSFCTDTALERALDVFWAKGYEATSITDLTDAMGIQRGSLYQAFGDKKSLFLAALERYLAEGRAESKRLLEGAESPLAALRQWSEKVMAGCPSRKGCFAVNATTELSPHDEDVAKITSAHWRSMEALVAESIRRGQDAGELRDDLEAADLAHLTVTALAGSQVLERQRPARGAQPAAVAATLAALVRP